MVDGDFEDLQIQLGLKEKRSKPRSNPILFKGDQVVMDKSHPIFQVEIKKAKKEKSKRKQEKKSRKRNRKR
jgi:uncharacterized protein YcfL